MSDWENVTCPFCKEKDFDLYGLQSHLERMWCDVYGKVEDPALSRKDNTPNEPPRSVPI